MLASANWFSGFDGSVVSHLAMQNSDHCPLLLTVPNAIPVTKRKKIFHFEALWTKDVRCREVIDQGWSSIVPNGSPMYRVVERLKSGRGSLINWCMERYRFLVATIKEKCEIGRAHV